MMEDTGFEINLADVGVAEKPPVVQLPDVEDNGTANQTANEAAAGRGNRPLGKGTSMSKKLIIAILASVAVLAITIGIGVGTKSKRTTSSSAAVKNTDTGAVTLEQCLAAEAEVEMEENTLATEEGEAPTYMPTYVPMMESSAEETITTSSIVGESYDLVSSDVLLPLFEGKSNDYQDSSEDGSPGRRELRGRKNEGDTSNLARQKVQKETVRDLLRDAAYKNGKRKLEGCEDLLTEYRGSKSSKSKSSKSKSAKSCTTSSSSKSGKSKSCKTASPTSSPTRQSAKSDKRIKYDIHPVGRSPSGIPMYTFKYKPWYDSEAMDNTYFGAMAQDLLELVPEAVFTSPDDGHYRVDYSKIDVDFYVAWRDLTNFTES